MKLSRGIFVLVLLALPLRLSSQHNKTKEHPVTPSELITLFDKADKVEIFVADKFNFRLIYSSVDAETIKQLKLASSVTVPSEWFRYACMPVGAIRLSTKGRKLPPIEIYEWTLLRFPGWLGDAPIANITNWLNWFDQRNIPAPRLEVEREEAREKAAEAAVERWKKGMPSSVREIWDKTSQNMDMIRPDSQPFADVLQREFPQKDNRIRAIFKWYGSGMGPWSGYPAYEQIGETLLLQYSTEELLHALDNVEWDDQLKEGVARFFAGWDFNSQRPEANTQIPSELKGMLLTYSLNSSDEDRIGRARKAFEH